MLATAKASETQIADVIGKAILHVPLKIMLRVLKKKSTTVTPDEPIKLPVLIPLHY